MKPEIQTSYGRVADLPIQDLQRLEEKPPVNVPAGTGNVVEQVPKRSRRELTNQAIAKFVDMHTSTYFDDQTGENEDEEVSLSLPELKAVIHAARKYIMGE